VLTLYARSRCEADPDTAFPACFSGGVEDPIRDLAPVGTIAEQPYILVVPPDAPGAT